MTGAVFLLIGLAAPLALALLMASAPLAAIAIRLAPWAALPALAASLVVDDVRVELPWLLLGSSFGLDPVRRVFLVFTSLLWTAAGVYGAAYHADDTRRRQLFVFHLVTLAGNLGLVLAFDAVTFYLFFVLMSLAAYGLVIHARTDEARRAGLIYIVLVFVGESLILPGLWRAVAAAPTMQLDAVAAATAADPLALGLLAAGFGVKAGMVPLHMWLPLAHPVAPTPSSAVLSGAMIKAGVLAWLVFLPVGAPGGQWLAASFAMIGLVTAFYGAAVGICQRRPKTVLAYSSISQMGFIMVATGAALTGATAAAVTAVVLYCLHHALAKGALFLGVGVVERTARSVARPIALGILAIPALALAGAPLTTGFAAKHALKDAAEEMPAALAWLVVPALSLAAIGTVLIMARFLWLVAAARPEAAGVRGLAAPWGALVAIGLAAAWPMTDWTYLADPGALWAATWPILAGIALALGAAAGRRRYPLPAIPEGDLVVPLALGVRWLRRAAGGLVWHGPGWWDAARGGLGASTRWAKDAEAGLTRPMIAGIAIVVVGLLVAVLMTSGP